MEHTYLKRDHGKVSLITEEGEMLLLAGELHNSSASSAAYMENVWGNLREMELNSVFAPVYWELMEPQENQFDFTLVEQLIAGAYAHGLKLILLWFGTWKNAMSSYTPQWVKTDFDRFPRVIEKNGRKNKAVSCFSHNALQCDARAFSALMAYVRENDPHHTVLMVQVENETGVLGTDRDYGAEAEACFQTAIPESLAEYLVVNSEQLSASLKETTCFEHLQQSWKKVFGIHAEEIFMAYYTAQYVNAVAKAGKKEYPLPMLVNAWTVQSEGEPAGFHPSGGPVADYHMIWKAAAPDIDLFVPDLYLENFKEECAAYSYMEHNPLFIPEMRKDRYMPGYIFYAIGGAHALCVSPFGIEDVGRIPDMAAGAVVQESLTRMIPINHKEILKQIYSLLGGMIPVIERYRSTQWMKGILQQRLPKDFISFPQYTLKISYPEDYSSIGYPGGGLVIRVSEEEYIFAGMNYRAEFIPMEEGKTTAEFISIEEGRYEHGTWIPGRRRNGDELSVTMQEEPAILRVKIFSY